jgi:hypothetical protein
LLCSAFFNLIELISLQRDRVVIESFGVSEKAMQFLLQVLEGWGKNRTGFSVTFHFPYYGKITKWKYYTRKNGSTIPGKMEVLSPEKWKYYPRKNKNKKR